MKAFQETDKFFKDQRLKWDKEAFKRRMSFEYINMGVGNDARIWCFYSVRKN